MPDRVPHGLFDPDPAALPAVGVDRGVAEHEEPRQLEREHLGALDTGLEVLGADTQALHGQDAVSLVLLVVSDVSGGQLVEEAVQQGSAAGAAEQVSEVVRGGGSHERKRHVVLIGPAQFIEDLFHSCQVTGECHGQETASERCLVQARPPHVLVSRSPAQHLSMSGG
ncbi:hypothetical protein ABZ864_24105 [Streptomyces sp. NPDC047082]|uniref:hypothetical protein n=1 Tax=Streptomyces sp. NPDC047082 TaxID=3155259 RepID=UPI0033D796BC